MSKHRRAVLAVLALFPVAAGPACAAVLQSSYAGGDIYGDQGYGVAVNPTSGNPFSGDVYLVGETASADFPGLLNSGPNGSTDTFVSRFSADLRTLKGTVMIGGSGTAPGETPCAIVVDPRSGDVVIAGITANFDFPTTPGVVQPQRAPGDMYHGDIFVARFDGALNLKQSTYYGGSSFSGDYCSDLTLDSATGDVFLLGGGSDDFPGTEGGAKPTGFSDPVVAHFSADLSHVQATYVGGNGPINSLAAAMGRNPVTGEIVVAGITSSPDFGSGTGAGFLAFYNPSLTQLLRVTRFQGDEAHHLAFDPTSGDILIVGSTHAPVLFDATGGALPTAPGGGDAFAARFTADGTFIRATFYGGSDFDRGNAVVVDPPSGDVLIWGDTYSADLVDAASGFQPSLNNTIDCFIARFDAGLTQLKQATYFGGSSSTEQAYGMVRDPLSGDLLVSGWSGMDDLPGIAGAPDPSGGAQDAFVARLTVDLNSTSTAPTPSFSITPVRSPSPTPTATSPPTGTPTTTAPRTATVTRTGTATATALPSATASSPSASSPTATASTGPTGTAASGAALSEALSATADRIPVDDIALFPARGTVRIDDERLRYDGTATSSAARAGVGPAAGALLNAVRGVDGTAAATHAAGALVVLVATTAPCAGDCNDDGAVTVDELVRAVNIALGNQPVSGCPAVDSNGDGSVAVNELVRAVGSTLAGCG